MKIYMFPDFEGMPVRARYLDGEPYPVDFVPDQSDSPGAAGLANRLTHIVRLAKEIGHPDAIRWDVYEEEDIPEWARWDYPDPGGMTTSVSRSSQGPQFSPD